MVYFVGAGPGAADLVTLRGHRLLREADIIVYAGSLVNEELLEERKEGCQVYNSAYMTLEEVLKVLIEGEKAGKLTVRLHTGDPCLYGAIKEQMDALKKQRIAYEVCPGVSSFCGAAAALKEEYTLPEVSQTVIITRMAGRTQVPKKEALELLASHGASMVIFLSTGLLPEVKERLLLGGYREDTPCAIVYKATWPEEKIIRGQLKELPEMAAKNGISKTALIVVGDFLKSDYQLSKLYDKHFTTEFRQGIEE